MSYNVDRCERMLKNIIQTKKLKRERYEKFTSELATFNQMIAAGKWEYAQLRKQLNKVNNHLIRMSDLDTRIKEYYDEAYEALRF